MALTASKTVYRAGFSPLPGGIFFAPFPNHYRSAGLLFRFPVPKRDTHAHTRTHSLATSPNTEKKGYDVFVFLVFWGGLPKPMCRLQPAFFPLS